MCESPYDSLGVTQFCFLKGWISLIIISTGFHNSCDRKEESPEKAKETRDRGICKGVPSNQKTQGEDCIPFFCRERRQYEE